MNVQQIRNILIAYLKATSGEVRIYEEKSIGNAVCDLMAVTDRLTGYEIKSDLDNYRQLDSQIAAYDQFFEKCYIVVGGRHLRSATEKVPAHWGIITIQSGHVIVNRPAQAGKPDGASQLAVLWRVELTNLLTKAGLPLYTYKGKRYIIQRIVEKLDAAEIRRHVTYELMHRDYALFDAKDYSLDQRIGLYAQAKELQKSKEEVLLRRTYPQTPHEIPYTDIQVSLGVPWVSRSIINDFAWFLRTGQEDYSTSHNEIEYEPFTGSWYVAKYRRDFWDRNTDRTRIESTYGLPTYNAMYILEAALNLREIRRETREETLAALEKQDAIQALFREWVWRDEDRRWEIEETYNKLFAGCGPKEYSGRQLRFPALSEEIRLYDYQKDAVMRVMSENNTLLAFDVGAGKTYIMIAAAMKMRQEGLSRKNLFVVPNHIVGQWELIFQQMYPGARVLSVAPDSFRPQMRQKVLGQIQREDYDGVIMAYSCFELIPLSNEYLMEQMERGIQVLDNARCRIRHSAICTAIDREKSQIRKEISGLMRLLEEDSGITFDRLEIDTLFVDEAHNFKNIPLHSHMRHIAGVNLTGSKRCLEMLHKVRCVQQQGRGAVFATGTPLCNSISDAYAMQSYLQYDKLRENSMDNFDNWVKTFAEPQWVCEIDVDTSKYRVVHRFAKFFNLPELSRLFSQIAVFCAMDSREDTPRLEGYSDVFLPRGPALESYMGELCARSEKIRAKQVNQAADNMLKVSTDGRKAALDLRLVGREQPWGEYSKVCRCVGQIMEIYRTYAGCSQIVFCDYSTPKGEFNIYDELKARLIEVGVPPREIAFIHSCRSEEEKIRLFEQVNRGVVRILLGSTFKLGIGANVQTRLKAIHHLDVPWRPSDMVQREGRILRRGNLYAEIKIFRYIAEGSFDSYSWQLLETKQRFISQFLAGSEYQRSASDLEENVLTYAQVKTLAISDPRMKVLAEKENELRRLELLSANHAHTRETQNAELAARREELARLGRELEAARQNAVYVGGISEEGFQAAYDNLKTALTCDVVLGRAAPPPELSVLGFGIAVPEGRQDDGDKPYVLLSRGGTDYNVPMGESAAGNARRLVNFLKRLPQLCAEIQERREICQREIKRLEAISEEKNPYLDRIKALECEIVELRSQIS